MYTSMGWNKRTKEVHGHILQTFVKPPNGGTTDNAATQKIALEEIKAPNNKSYVIGEEPDSAQRKAKEDPDFMFEKNRLKELGEAEISKYKIDGPVTEIDKGDPRAVRVSLYNEAVLEKETSSISRWSVGLKTLSVTIIIWSVLEVIFSMIFTFIMALYDQSNILRNTIPMIVNILNSAWMISIAIRGGSVSSIIDPEATTISRHIKFSMVTLLVFMIQFIVMPCIQSIPKSVYSLSDIGLKDDTDESAERRGEAFMGLGYIMVWISSLISALECTLELCFTYVLRKYMRLREIHALEQKTLPLGYQVYANLPPQEQGISIPYKV